MSQLGIEMENEVKLIKSEVLKMCWHMRGGISYEDAMMLSYEDRTLIASLIEKNIDTTNKTGLPFF